MGRETWLTDSVWEEKPGIMIKYGREKILAAYYLSTGILIQYREKPGIRI